VFIVTYAIAFLAFGFDLRNTIVGFKDGNRGLSPDSCSSQGINPNEPPDGSSYGCSFENPTVNDGPQKVWMGHASEWY
jgi:hypothetical protein